MAAMSSTDTCSSGILGVSPAAVIAVAFAVGLAGCAAKPAPTDHDLCTSIQQRAAHDQLKDPQLRNVEAENCKSYGSPTTPSWATG